MLDQVSLGGILGSGLHTWRISNYWGYSASTGIAMMKFKVEQDLAHEETRRGEAMALSRKFYELEGRLGDGYIGRSVGRR